MDPGVSTVTLTSSVKVPQRVDVTVSKEVVDWLGCTIGLKLLPMPSDQLTTAVLSQPSTNVGFPPKVADCPGQSMMFAPASIVHWAFNPTIIALKKANNMLLFFIVFLRRYDGNKGNSPNE